MSPVRDWIKCARLLAHMPYPPVSAWEFASLKTEAAVRERLKPCTVYIIGQRPLLRFDKVVVGETDITFEIGDGVHPPLTCRVDPLDAGVAKPGEAIDVECGFHRQGVTHAQPFMDVASIRIYGADGAFKVWWSPQKLLFEAQVRGLPVTIKGDLAASRRFEVHYIGQAFSQSVWERLKAHEKLQDVLTLETVRGTGHTQPSYEITLFMLDIHGIDELVSRADDLEPEEDLAAPILHAVPEDPTDPASIAFLKPWIGLRDKALTTEVEAMLINLFKPEHNSIHFDNYPQIKGGLRDLGFTDTELRLEGFPFSLTTKSGEEPLEDDLSDA